MLYFSSTADIHHLLQAAPVDLEALFLFHRLNMRISEFPRNEGLPELRYRECLRIASLRLLGNPSEETPKNDYLAMLVHHHARSILIPRCLWRKPFVRSKAAIEGANYFSVPLRVFKKRLEDADILRHLSEDRTGPDVADFSSR